MRSASITFAAAVLLACAAGCSAQASGLQRSAASRKLLATRTVVWATHSYKPMTLKAGTLVKFKWAGFHDLAVSKKNEFGKRKCVAARVLVQPRNGGSFTIRVAKGFFWYSCTVASHCKSGGQAILIKGV